jgi:hypothetical protein
MRNNIEKLAANNWINLIIALVCLATGVSDIFTTTREIEQSGIHFHAGHGIAALGSWNALQALGSIFSSFDYASKAAG